MPKIKTHKGASKRFRVTASGKLKRKKRNQNHLLSKKSSKLKRALGKGAYVSDADAPNIKAIIPYNM
ncbi:MAG: 50S ribosomal protein L35 [Myxococcota bacterium]